MEVAVWFQSRVILIHLLNDFSINDPEMRKKNVEVLVIKYFGQLLTFRSETFYSTFVGFVKNFY